MYGLILILLLLVALLVYICYSIGSSEYKLDVTTLSLNELISKEYPSFMELLIKRVEPYYYLTIIPDDLFYLDHHLKWSTKHTSVHLAEIQRFIDNIIEFITDKKKLNDTEFLNRLDEFIEKRLIKIA